MVLGGLLLSGCGVFGGSGAATSTGAPPTSATTSAAATSSPAAVTSTPATSTPAGPQTAAETTTAAASPKAAPTPAPKPAPKPGYGNPPPCPGDIAGGAACRFLKAHAAGSTSGMTADEKAVASQLQLPPGEWKMGDCELVGDVTAECRATWMLNESAKWLKVTVAPSNGEWTGETMSVPPGETLQYQVVEAGWVDL